MHFVIMGCGRVGASLASHLDSSGHSVAVIDMDPDSFRRLPPDFSGRRVTGMGFDRDALIQAGVEDAYALAAVSNGDNSNIITARVARDTFGVRRVVARIYDPHRAEVYQKLGITTVATVRWTTDQFLRRILPKGSEVEYRDSTGTVTLASVDLHPEWIGRRASQLEAGTGARIAFISRGGTSLVPGPTTVLQENDLPHVVAPTDSLPALQRRFTSRPTQETR
ncbi:MAG: TrkA family potassium uptake protein [bacterium]|nr:TrkA family potassium uptake protein [bacterium]